MLLNVYGYSDEYQGFLPQHRTVPSVRRGKDFLHAYQGVPLRHPKGSSSLQGKYEGRMLTKPVEVELSLMLAEALSSNILNRRELT